MFASVAITVFIALCSSETACYYILKQTLHFVIELSHLHWLLIGLPFRAAEQFVLRIEFPEFPAKGELRAIKDWSQVTE